MDTVCFIQVYEQNDKNERLHQELLIQSLVKYFTKESTKLERIIPIIERTSEVSLRLLDWFIVCYAKELDVTYNYQGKPFNVYSNYRQQLQHFTKKYFDAFRRHTRTCIYFENTQTQQMTDLIETTLGQLCFFRW